MGSGLCNPSHYECVSKRRLLAKFLGADLSYRIHARLGNQTAAFGARAGRIGESAVSGNVTLAHRVADIGFRRGTGFLDHTVHVHQFRRIVEHQRSFGDGRMLFTREETIDTGLALLQ